MFGKNVKLNDFKFLYGQETIYVNIYAVFKYLKNNEKYVIFSYDNKKLCYGSAFIRDNEIVIMSLKNNDDDLISDFLLYLFEKKEFDKYEIISLEKINSVQIIDENIYGSSVDIDKLFDIAMPKEEIIDEEVKPKKKKRISFTSICVIILFIVLVLFFFVNPEVIIGKNREYICNKNYVHKDMPSVVNEEITLVFNGKGNILSIDIKSDYVFNSADYYAEFKDKSHFYKYIKEGDTYKFDDINKTYRLFSKVNTEEEYFMPSIEEELLLYYDDFGYKCKMIEEE